MTDINARNRFWFGVGLLVAASAVELIAFFSPAGCTTRTGDLADENAGGWLLIWAVPVLWLTAFVLLAWDTGRRQPVTFGHVRLAGLSVVGFAFLAALAHLVGDCAD